jgi:hypothetical protein
MLWSQYKLGKIRRTDFLRKETTGILNIPNWKPDFLTLQTSEFQKKNPTGIFRIENRIGIPLTMGVPEIGTKNRNSQPSLVVMVKIISSCLCSPVVVQSAMR